MRNFTSFIFLAAVGLWLGCATGSETTGFTGDDDDDDDGSGGRCAHSSVYSGCADYTFWGFFIMRYL